MFNPRLRQIVARAWTYCPSIAGGRRVFTTGQYFFKRTKRRFRNAITCPLFGGVQHRISASTQARVSAGMVSHNSHIAGGAVRSTWATARSLELEARTDSLITERALFAAQVGDR